MATSKKTVKDVRTRRAILDMLKQAGSLDAKEMSEVLGVSAMAVRQHLYALQAEELVTFHEESRPMGRPAKMWGLTRAADSFFPNGHADLTVRLLQAMELSFGEEGLTKLLEARSAQQIADYQARVPRSDDLRERAEGLARIRTEEGYMAHIEHGENGDLLLIENHCPICIAAAECQGLCANELHVFQCVFGDGVSVERVDHIQAGASRCAYRISQSR